MNMTHKFSNYISAITLLCMVSMPMAYASENSEKTMGQRTEQAESAIKDAWIDGKLETTLLFNEHLNSFDIDTDVKNGIARLSGVVESDIDRDLAGEIAKSIKGVTSVENELRVDKQMADSEQRSEAYKERQGFKQSVKDATLTAQIKTKLLLNSNTSGLAINVDSNNGEVTLSGIVKSEEEEDLAVKIAGNVEGVKTVNDRLTVENSGRNS
ncbi:MAG: BON domain-containing protein [Lysobacterales bacterium]